MRTETRNKTVDNLNNVQGSDILAGYKIAERDENPGTTSYYGFVDTAGNWYIMREVTSGTATTTTFAAGSSNFSSNWTGRAGLSYVTFDSLF